MANDAQKRSVLDQMTDEATTPQPLPGPLSPIVGQSAAPLPPELGNTPPLPVPPTTVADDSTNELEKEASSPTALASRIAAAQATEKEDHPSFLTRLKHFAGGVVGVGDPTNPDVEKGSEAAGVLGRIGSGLAMAAGTPEEKQIGEEESQVPLKIAQIQNERDYRRALLGINQEKATTGQQNADTKSAVAKQATIPLAGAKVPNIEANTAKTELDIETMKQGMYPMPAWLAYLVHRPDLADKPVSAALWKGINEGPLAALGLKTTDLGEDGLWVLNRVGNKINQVSAVSPSMARGEAYGRNRPVQALDPTDNTVKWMTAGQAENLGAAPAQAGSQIMSKQAQFRDIYSGIGAMRASINGLKQEPLDADTIRTLTQATRETDPTIAKQIFDTVLGTQQLTPAQQDFVVALQQLNERVLSVRNLAGMGNASDSLRAAIRATLPSAKSGDPTLMRKQLDSVQNFVDNLYSGVPNVRTNASAPTAPSAGGSTPPKVQSFKDWQNSQKPKTAGGQ